MAAHIVSDLPAVDPREHDVEHDQVGFRHLVESVVAILHLEDLVAAKREEPRDGHPGRVIVLDELKLDEIKTKAFAKVLENLKIGGKSLFVLGDMDQNVILSARNLPDTKTTQTSEMNVYDVMNAQTLVITKDAVAKIEEVYA